MSSACVSRWEASGQPLVEDEHRYAAGPLLVLPRARPQDSGRYTCVASNVAGSARLDANLVVTTPLSARVTPSQVTAALGQPASFTCSPAGSPITQVYWTKDGQVWGRSCTHDYHLVYTRKSCSFGHPISEKRRGL